MRSFIYLSIAVVITLTVGVPAPTAHAASFDAVLLRIDAFILELQVLKQEVEKLKDGGVSSSANAASVSSSLSGSNLSDPVVSGETNSSIKRVQALLATDPTIYPDGIVSGFFGPKTEAAIRKFQARFGLDSVGHVGPATKALLEQILSQYPNGNYPEYALSIQAPKKQTTTTTRAQEPSTVSQKNTNSSGIRTIDVEIERGEGPAVVTYTSGERKRFTVSGRDEDDVIKDVASRLKLSRSTVEDLIEVDFEDSNDDDSEYDEGDAEDAIKDAEDAIDEADGEIDDNDDDGEDVDYARDTLDEAEDLFEEAEEAFDDEDYDEAVEKAEEAEDLADTAVDRIGEDDNNNSDSEDIDEIQVEVKGDESEVVVEYENGEEDDFDINENEEDEIIKEIADRLDIDEDDVEDVIEFDFGDIKEIEVVIEDGEDSEVTVKYEDGFNKVEFELDEDIDRESDIIEAVADELDIKESTVENKIDFDYVGD